MEFIEFKEQDASFCFQIRTAAFIVKFYEELGSEAVSAAVTSYLPDDYIRMSREMKIFLICNRGEKIGFLCIKKFNQNSAEIPFVYLDLPYIGKGYGGKAIKFAENWVRENWKDVKKIFLDTIIPKYNGGFYEKMGYQSMGNTRCTFNKLEVHAVRYEKNFV